jgi:hypothetical protein
MKDPLRPFPHTGRLTPEVTPAPLAAVLLALIITLVG